MSKEWHVNKPIADKTVDVYVEHVTDKEEVTENDETVMNGTKLAGQASSTAPLPPISSSSSSSSTTTISRAKETITTYASNTTLYGDLDPLGYPSARATVAYAVSISYCPINTTSVLDGPAILAYSIHLSSIRANKAAKYDYKLFAFIHPDAADCAHFLSDLGYETLIRDNPVNVSKVSNWRSRAAMEQRGCCGSKEFMKLLAYSLVDYPIVVHFDTDIVVQQPMDELFDAMLDEDATKHKLPVMFGKPLPKRIDAFFTRDYLLRSKLTNDTSKYAVQGGFLVIRPNTDVLEQMTSLIEGGAYGIVRGWGRLLYGGFWGAAQFQGFMSYFFGEIQSTTSVELNRCVYNSMIDDDPLIDGRCRTGEENCEDCRTRPFEDIKVVHHTTCWKPWDVSTERAAPIVIVIVGGDGGCGILLLLLCCLLFHKYGGELYSVQEPGQDRDTIVSFNTVLTQSILSLSLGFVSGCSFRDIVSSDEASPPTPMHGRAPCLVQASSAVRPEMGIQCTEIRLEIRDDAGLLHPVRQAKAKVPRPEAAQTKGIRGYVTRYVAAAATMNNFA